MTSALAGGLVTVAGTALIALALPSFTRYRRGHPPAAGRPAVASATATVQR